MGLVRGLVTVLVLLLVAAVGYEIGLAQNVVAQVGAEPHVAYSYTRQLVGSSVSGLVFAIVFLGLLSAAFACAGRGRGPGWGHEERRRGFEEMHRELHGERSTGGPASTA